MKNATSFIRYMSEREAIFRYEEYSYAKHAHFQDKQAYRTLRSREQIRAFSDLNCGKPLVLCETSGFFYKTQNQEVYEVNIPTIDLVQTGANIINLRKAAGLTVHDLQIVFGFNSPQALYKWQSGASLPTVDNLIVLAALFRVHIDDILVTTHS